MKHLSKYFSTANADDVELDEIDKLSGQDLSDFVDAASGSHLDTKEDRLLTVFSALRKSTLSNKWHTIPGMRAFLLEHYGQNPFLPADIRELEFSSRAIAPNPSAFISDWIEEKLPLTDFEIPPAALFDTINKLPSVRDRFVANNLHDSSYFFSKYTEWHISRVYAELDNCNSVVDIGAAYDGFAQTLCAFSEKLEITLVDLAFPPGLRNKHKQIKQLGADAGDMNQIATGSVDLVCVHNAFEHFASDSDMRCIREIERILRPGGKALITPFFFAAKHSVTINPAACFLFGNTDELTQYVREELNETGGRLDFNNNIVSPYARRYDLETTQKRILATAKNMSVMLKRATFPVDFVESLALESAAELLLVPKLYKDKLFYFLEFTKN
ncbi:MAG: class I SAM-dependent methyltransferase [Hyphomonadaceae bacterium]|nr:class I SAM-dependent methyltransferase [Hyphomonadaceae bacterium]